MSLESPRPLPSDLRERVARAVERSAREDGLIGAVVFGSVARGTAGPWSDVDVGVLRRAGDDRGWEAELAADLAAILGRPADVVDLRRAALPLRARALREANPAVVLDADAWATFVATTTLDWLDFAPTYRAAVATAITRLAGSAP